MARAVPYSPLATYTVIPLTSSLPEDDYSTKTAVNNSVNLPKILLGIFIFFMIISTILGNSLVCLAVFLVRKLQQPANYLIVSLAVADCLVGLLVMPLALVDLLFEEWPLGSSWCKLWTTADLTLCTASIVNLCMISVDRYKVISSPLRYSVQRTSRRMIIYIGIVWTTAALVSLSSHIIGRLLYENGADQNGCQVIDHFAYQIYATIISFYGPTITMVILYVKIWRAAKRIAKQDRSLSCNGTDLEKNGNENSDLLEKKQSDKTSGKPRLSGSKLFRSDRKYLHRPSALLQAVKLKNNHNDGQDCKARKTLGVIMSVFIICWFPFFLFAILKSCFNVRIPYWLDTFALWLGYSNSTLNPAIYCKYNKEFRVPFREILSCRCGTLQMVLRQQSFTSRYGAPIARRPSSHPECSDV